MYVLMRPRAWLAGVLMLGFAGPAMAQDIEFFGGGADATWFYDSVADSWDVVFRAKADADATGLTNPYPGPPGGVGGSADDFLFDSWHTLVGQPGFGTVNGVGYYLMGNSGAPGKPDIGIRTRLRELDNGDAIDQFDVFRMTLDWDNSTKPAGAEFMMVSETPGDIRYETIDNNFAFDWTNWGHGHFFWGFSELGDYELKFDFQGIGGPHGPSSVGSLNLSFSIVPEPSGGLLALGAATCLMLMRRRRRV